MISSISPLALRRLAVQIESAVNARREDWDPADEAQFRRLGSTLPRPADLREWAQQWEIQKRPPNGAKVFNPKYIGWVRAVNEMQQIVSRNKPGSYKKMLKAAMKGRPAGGDWGF